MRDNDGSAGTDIIVLGRRLGDRGELSEIFRLRLAKAAHVWRQRRDLGRSPRIVVSGGDLGGRGISEAQAGADWLEGAEGIPPLDLVREEQALDTVSNAVYCKLVVMDRGCRRPVVVSSCYHIPRVSYLFSHVLGPEFEPTYVSAPTGLDPEGYGRHWRSESRKMIEAVRFIDEIDASPGDHVRVLGHLREKGLVIEDTVD